MVKIAFLALCAICSISPTQHITRLQSERMTIHLRSGHAYFHFTVGKFTTVIIDEGYVSAVYYRPGLLKDQKRIYAAYSAIGLPIVEDEFKDRFEYKKGRLYKIDGETIAYKRRPQAVFIERFSTFSISEDNLTGKIGSVEGVDIWYDNTKRPTKVGKVSLSWDKENNPYGVAGSYPIVIIE